MPSGVRCFGGQALVEVVCRMLGGRGVYPRGARRGALLVAILARAQRRTGMRVCAVVPLSDRCCLLLRPLDADQLALFMAHVDSNIARAVGRQRGVWDRSCRRRAAEVVIRHDAGAQEQRLRHLLTRGLREGRGTSSRRGPAADLRRAAASRATVRGVWVEPAARRGAFWRASAPAHRNRARRELLELSPLPAWDALNDAQLRARAARLLCGIEEDSG